MKIVVVVRWNLRFTGENRASQKARDRRLTDGWHEERLRLFYTYCWPSIRRAALHVDVPLCVAVAVDPDMPQQKAAFLNRRVVAEPGPACLVVDDWPLFAREQTGQAVLWVRLDSDDMLAPYGLRYFFDIAAYIKQPVHIAPSRGLCYHEPTHRFFEWENEHPPVFGLYTPAGTSFPKDPHLCHHAKGEDVVGRSVCIETHRPIYCVGLHHGPGENVSNSLRKARDGSPWVGKQIDPVEPRWLFLGETE